MILLAYVFVGRAIDAKAPPKCPVAAINRKTTVHVQAVLRLKESHWDLLARTKVSQRHGSGVCVAVLWTGRETLGLTNGGRGRRREEKKELI